MADIVIRREYKATLTIGTDYIGSVEEYRDSVWYSGDFLTFPQPSEIWQGSGQILEYEQLTIQIADPAGTWKAAAPGWRGQMAVIELITQRYLSDGTVDEATTKRGMTVSAWRIGTAEVQVTIRDLDYLALEQLYPANIYTADDWPDLWEDHVGLPVSDVVGQGRHVPCAYLTEDSGSGTGPWIFGGPIIPSTGTITVQTVYAEGRIVDGSQYSISSRTGASSGIEVLTVEFTTEPYSVDGSLFAITIDCTGGYDRNAATEVRRLIQDEAGLAVAGTTWDDAATEATSRQMYIDWAYTERVTFRSIIEPYLGLLRATIRRGAGGNIRCVQDRTGTAVATLNEAEQDNVSVAYLAGDSAPTAVSMQYGQRRDDPSQTTYEIERSVTGGTDPKAQPIVAPWIKTHGTADRYLCYVQRLYEYSLRAGATVTDAHYDLGDILAIEDPPQWSGSKSWFIREVRRGVDHNELSLSEYNAGLFSYSASPAPAGYASGYLPDYSSTPPATPTNLSIVSSGTTKDNLGKIFAWVTVRCTPPSVNWSKIWLTAVDDGDSTVHRQQGSAVAGGFYQAKIGQLRPGQAHTILASAENQYGLEGTAASTPHTSQTSSSAPAAPTGVTATQIAGNSVQISWSAGNIPDLDRYEIERRLVTGSYVYAGHVGGNTKKWIDGPLTYSATARQWRVRGVDKSGNASGYAESNTLAVSQNIGGSHITPTDPVLTNQIVNELIGKIVTAGLIRTSASGKRVEVQNSSNEIRFYDSGGSLIGSAGQNSQAGDNYIFYAYGSNGGAHLTSTSSIRPAASLINTVGTTLSISGGTSFSPTVTISGNSSGDALQITSGDLYFQGCRFEKAGTNILDIVFPNGRIWRMDAGIPSAFWIT